MDRVDHRMAELEDRIIGKTVSAFLLVIGFSIVAFGIIFYALEALGWPRGASVIALGAVLVIAGFAMKYFK
ncbi:hypothetical protein KW805_03750 [Candidatus Pacearchaeota archaeon]|nr:hypothetical protein [Candidatus Pacearchaeota archaeon]